MSEPLRSKPRNLLLIVADQWRGDILPKGHGGWLDLPNLHRLCASGTRFSRHYSNATPCAPARMSLLTGQYVMNHRVVQNGIPLPRDRTNLALELRKGGHLPALVGYTSWTPDPRDATAADPRYAMFGAAMPGWTPIRSLEEPDFQLYFGYLDRLGYRLPADPFDIWRIGPESPPTPTPVRREHSDTAWLTDGALEFLSGRNGGGFCLFLGYWRPHPPFSAPAPYHEAVAPADLPPPVRAATTGDEAGLHPFLDHLLATDPADHFVQGAEGLASGLDDHRVTAARLSYCGLVKEIDDHLGRIFRYLDEAGLWDSTLIVFTSDHGEALGDHYLFGKSSFFDPTFHTPLVVRDPRPQADVLRGQVIDRFTEHVDIMPTILDWTGIPVPRQCDGRSLLPLLAGQDAPWRDAAFMEMDFRDLRGGAWHEALGLTPDQCGVAILRDDQHKYVHFTALPPLLFDLERDPGEFRSLADDPDYARVLSDCRSRMLDWRIGAADRTLTGISASPGGLVGHL